jgi:hypothetical protein
VTATFSRWGALKHQNWRWVLPPLSFSFENLTYLLADDQLL